MNIVIDRISEYAGTRRKKGQTGYHFNVYIEGAEYAVLLQGVRLMTGKIYPPGYHGQGKFHNHARVNPELAEAIYEKVKELEQALRFPKGEKLKEKKIALEDLAVTFPQLVVELPNSFDRPKHNVFQEIFSKLPEKKQVVQPPRNHIVADAQEKRKNPNYDWTMDCDGISDEKLEELLKQG